MARALTIFAKGNLDVRDSLHALRRGETVVWNGVNEIVRARFPGASVRVRHELWTRSDALLEATGGIPPALLNRGFPLDPYDLTTQFSRAVFDSDADAFVFSLQPDVMTALVRHRRDGYLLYPHDREKWPGDDQRRLAEEFTPASFLDVEQSMRNISEIVTRMRANTDAPILIYNMSAVVLGESVRCYTGLPEVLSTRIRRFNLGLTELSRETGVSVIDVDRIVACGGADRLKLDTLHLTAEGCRAVAGDVVDALDELNCFAATVA